MISYDDVSHNIFIMKPYVFSRVFLFLLYGQIIFHCVNTSSSDLFNVNHFTEGFLQNILRVRIPGTIGHEKVKQYIQKTLLDLEWNVLIDEFTSYTPLNKNIKFYNIIGTFNKSSPKVVAMACHYDSKYFEPKDDEYFIGATDSAVPCSILLYLAKILTPVLSRNHQTTLQLHFIDGEEAFKNWSPSDSLYGSRHLVKTLNRTTHEQTTMLKSIDLFILLDLLGYKSPRFYSYFIETAPEFEKMCQIGFVYNLNLCQS